MKKGVACRTRTGLVGDAPKSHCATILVAVKHLGEHSESLVHRRSILEVDALPNRDFLPEDYAQPLGKTHRVLVLGIVCKTYHIDAQLLCLGEELPGVGLGESPSHTLRYLLMKRYTAHERRTSVHEYACAVHSDVAETDFLGYGIAGLRST